MTIKDFSQRWITNIVAAIDELLDDRTKARIMESSGRACARSGVIDSAQASASDLDRFLSTMRKWVGRKNAVQEGGNARLFYEKCYCGLRELVPAEAAATFCSCFQGWLREMFETVVGKPVDVEIESTILRGADRCRFVVRM